MSEVHSIKVEVYEDGKLVAYRVLGYYPGQVYEVKVETPDGVDWSSDFVVPMFESVSP